MPTKSSRNWLREHFSDFYVKQAKLAGYRSRSAYKLQEIDERDHLFKPGMTVIDLGAAPGGFAQYVVQRLGGKGRLLAIDLLPMEPIAGVDFIQGDFSDPLIGENLLLQLSGAKADWVISDMAPNLSGNASIDMPRIMHLADCALDFAKQTLNPAGGFLIKVFHGEGFEALIAEIKRNFINVAIRKPKASRGRSKEVYILARKLKNEVNK